MNIKTFRVFPGTPFRISVSPIKNPPGILDSSRVGVYKNDVLVGEYIYNSPTNAGDIFYPFEVDGTWYATYSADYTSLGILKITDTGIEDWTTCIRQQYEETLDDFVVTEVYVPKYHAFEHLKVITDNNTVYTTDSIFESLISLPGYKYTQYCNFGFCVGHYDHEDKERLLHYIDLSDVENKKATIEEKFGYWEIPNNMSVKKAVNTDNWTPEYPAVLLSRQDFVLL